jgi:prepilin signal peptidase PulO-like enzyme (type II secretory pathway)
MAKSVLGGFGLAGFYLVLALVSPSGMGMGDVKAAAGLGTMLAWRGWTALIAGGFAGFLFAAVYGITLLVSGRATRNHQIPFGPFMIAGAFLVTPCYAWLYLSLDGLASAVLHTPWPSRGGRCRRSRGADVP